MTLSQQKASYSIEKSERYKTCREIGRQYSARRRYQTLTVVLS
jgi:hypothetical protein